MKKTDLAWLAGIIDGEGCIHIAYVKPSIYNKRKSARYPLILAVEMTDKPTIDKIMQIFDFGTTQTSRRTKKRITYKVNYRITKAVQVLKAVYPYLVTKKKQAQLALRYAKIKPAPSGQIRPERLTKIRETYYLLMRRLKQWR